MDKLKKYIWIASTIFLLATNVGTIVFYGKQIDSNTKATDLNTAAVIELVGIAREQKTWNEGHNQRHEDHKELHDAQH